MINGYEIIGDWVHSANGSYAFCTKNGETYFIKKMPNPVKPYNGLPEESYKRLLKIFEDEFDRKGKLSQSLKLASKKCRYIVPPTDVFVHDVKIFVVSPKVEGKILSLEEITRKTPKEKYKLMLRFTEALVAIHEQRIIHGDIKPSNVFVLETPNGMEPRLIDFDDSYFESGVPDAPTVVGTPEYFSPELGQYSILWETRKEDRELLRRRVTCKNDVFATGILFHEFITGRRPVFNGSKIPFRAKDDQRTLIGGDPFRQILKSMLILKMKDRPDSSQILKQLNDMAKVGSPAIPRTTPDISTGQSIRKETSPKEVRMEKIVHTRDDKYRCFYSDGTCQTVPQNAARGLSQKKKIRITEE